MAPPTFKIGFSEDFGNLPNAPIVEAVIHWRARPGKKLEPAELLSRLKQRLPDYPTSQNQQELTVDGAFGPDSSSIQQHQQWQGFRFVSEDKLHIAQFTRNGFVFSRLKPYENWDTFSAEAQRLWQIYREEAEPSEIERLGVRFINRVAPVRLNDLKGIVTLAPQSPPEMPLPVEKFLHQTIFDIPGHPYNLNVIQTIQPSSPPQSDAWSLILDLDVFTTQPSEIDEQKTQQQLREMRWIKNKAFFSMFTSDALQSFRE